jgi:MOSC domain-containing protein YiiM
MSRHGTIHALNVSPGGVPKWPIDEAQVTVRGITGDRQRDLRNHGGPMRALCLYALERIAEGHYVEAGSTGENVTVEGIDWSLVVPGARLRLGADVLIEVTDYTTPCLNNACWFLDGNFNRINQRVAPGWARVYARVLSEGVLHPGDPVELLEESAGDRVARTQPTTYRWSPPAR